MSYKQLGDFSNIKGGKRLPKGQMLVATPTNHPYIRVRDLGKSKTLELDSSFEYIEQETFEKIARYIVNENDIIISIVGTIGLIGKVGSTLDGANLTENCAKIVDVEGFDKDFLYYYLTSNEGQSAIHAYTVGAVQQKLPLKNIIELMIPDIPLENQKKIAKTLSVFDDRIAENKKINHHLEQIAKAIFYEKFGNQVPNGLLGDLASVSSGKRPPIKVSERTATEDIPILGAASIMGYTSKSLYSEKILVTGRVGTHGIIQRYNRPCWPSDNALVLKSDDYELVYQNLLSIDFSSMNRGSTQPLITQTDLKNVAIYIPTQIELSDFEDTVGTIMQQYESNIVANESLVQLRDSLLPKLMSGEISVTD
ncbi:restriction endonuclease subunit S [Latilactobacillus curvatus]|uniref:restriction endonuclease subunit S n=1 Tax=Latilactobacillus curvatus TaxID=28038 RepID=UPI00217D6401|nr:restriction endonuclease subunit S [Latilactobacillus curvatus]